MISPRARTQEERETDVLVIGGGLAGHCAAIAAAERGARVVLLEKQPSIGGSTVLSGGFFAFADTPVQRSLGIADTAELFYEDLRKVGGCDNDERLLRAFVDGQRELFDWLVELGVAFNAVELSAGQTVPRSHQTNAARVIELLAAAAAGSGRVTSWSQAAVQRLLRDGGTGPVTGVRATTPTGVATVEARGGVVLATGGFSRSETLLRMFVPGQARALRMGGAGNTGDGLRMAWQLGAGFRDMGYVKGTFGTHPLTGPERHEILLVFYLGAVIVNRLGFRFVDESASYKILGDACLEQPGAIAYQIFDQQVMDASRSGVPLFDLAPALERGLLFRAQTLQGLADLCGIDGENLVDTLRTYNSGVDAGRDPVFGRDGLCNHAGALVRLDCPPFYAYPSTSVVLATYCGLTVTPKTEVLDVFGDKIEGLFAAGEIVGGFHGSAYMTGTSLGKAALFGRVAGFNAARRAGTAH